MTWAGIREQAEFRTIPHRRQRYRTCGDYFKHGPNWLFQISRMKDKRYCWLILFHEFIEWGICRALGVNNQLIDRFDMLYEKHRSTPGATRAACGCAFQEEPGNDIHAPYRTAHQAATECERIVAKTLGVDWDDYGAAVERLG